MAKRKPSGETPLADISGLRVKGIKTRVELDVLEADNVRKAIVKYLGGKPSPRRAPFDFTWTLKLHREMFGDVWKWAGLLRTCDLNLGVPWAQIEPSLYGLLQDLFAWEEGGMGLLEQAAMLHHRAVLIHPFMNGNGRWSRMLANIWLKQHDSGPTAWPEQFVGRESPVRREYLAAIRKADEGDYEPLFELHRRYTPPGETPG